MRSVKSGTVFAHNQIKKRPTGTQLNDSVEKWPIRTISKWFPFVSRADVNLNQIYLITRIGFFLRLELRIRLHQRQPNSNDGFHETIAHILFMFMVKIGSSDVYLFHLLYEFKVSILCEAKKQIYANNGHCLVYCLSLSCLTLQDKRNTHSVGRIHIFSYSTTKLQIDCWVIDGDFNVNRRAQVEFLHRRTGNGNIEQKEEKHKSNTIWKVFSNDSNFGYVYEKWTKQTEMRREKFSWNWLKVWRWHFWK